MEFSTVVSHDSDILRHSEQFQEVPGVTVLIHVINGPR
jgi:hypothetical protein